jgi:5-methyltetrahydrofolate--homocysteine methyltransferase
MKRTGRYLERRVDICEKAYKILTEEVGFDPQDIIFDPNIFAIATGLKNIIIMPLILLKQPGSSNKKCRWQKMSGGVSNVSFLSAAMITCS